MLHGSRLAGPPIYSRTHAHVPSALVLHQGIKSGASGFLLVSLADEERSLREFRPEDKTRFEQVAFLDSAFNIADCLELTGSAGKGALSEV